MVKTARSRERQVIVLELNPGAVGVFAVRQVTLFPSDAVCIPLQSAARHAHSRRPGLAAKARDSRQVALAKNT
jgi:hypothetical protein